jgi:hypothetical protein
MAFQRTDATLRWLRTPSNAIRISVANDGPGATVFGWLRHTLATASPRSGLGAGAADPRLGVNNNANALRGFFTSAALTTSTTTVTGGVNSPWTPIGTAFSIVGGTGFLRAVGNRVLLTASGARSGVSFTNFTVGQDPGDNSFDDTGEWAHCAAWNAALSDAELWALNSGANPLRIRPGNLIGYWPLDGDGRNLAMPVWPLNPAGSATSAPVWVPGPPGIEPPQGRPIWLYAAPAAGGTVYNDTISDSVTASDTVTAAATVRPSVSDSTTGSDSLSASATVRPAISDSRTASDTVAATATVRPAIGDTVTGGDTAAGSIGGAGTIYNETISDTLFASDIVDALSGGVVIITPLPVTPPPPPGRRRMRFLEGVPTPPEEPLAEPTGAGNTLLQPPRRTGRDFDDVTQMFDWMQSLYEAVAVEANVLGSIEALTASIASAERKIQALEARVADLEERLNDVGALTQLAGPISGTYDAAQLAAAYNAINAIIVRAKG